MKKTQCPKCSNTMEIPDEYVNRNVKCPHCGNQFDAAERVSSKVTSGIKKKRTGKKSNSLPMKIAGVLGIVILALLIGFFIFGKSPPPDAFIKEIKNIPKEVENGDFFYSFELVDYDIVISDSLVYTHECVMRFISTSKSIEHSVSATSEYQSQFRYNSQTTGWELYSLERVNTEYDFSGSEEFAKIEEAKSRVTQFTSEIEENANKRDALGRELIETVSKQLEAIDQGKTSSAESKERERLQKKLQAEIKELDMQADRIRNEGESFMASQGSDISDLTDRMSAIKKLG